MTMSISVLVPAFNASRTIGATLESVLHQTLPPAEIIVLDDGSTDDTAEIVRRFAPQVKLISTRNAGAAAARNTLYLQSSGELLAFLDSDDLWHPNHLQIHSALAAKFPEAVALFSEHINFDGFADYQWEKTNGAVGSSELISALDFFARYHKSPGPFSSMSFCSVPRSTFTRLTEPPFQANGAEDYYFFTRINLFGPIAFSSAQTVAYRFHAGSLSSNKLRVVGIAVQAYELLEREYKDFPDKRFYKAFQNAVASKRRHYAKLLFGASAVAAGRDQLRRSLGDSSAPISLSKSLGLLLASYLPEMLRPRWPGSSRQEVIPDTR